MGKINGYLETERLIMREIEEQDAEFIVELRSKPEVYRYFISPHKITVEEHMRWFQNSYVHNDERIDFIAVRKDDRQAIGVFGIKAGDEFKEEAEVSYILDSRYQGKGFAKEAVLELVKYAGIYWKSDTVTAVIHKDNLESIIFAKNAGFIYRGSDGVFETYYKRVEQVL